ncbi:hypothetical protein F5B19DRAFT_73178 [Rostrohypoxylon terebratum]|nr:hypothetical protein F5B19DRAFT_73178 [Rostrohypoxylon terebratum]
MAAPEAITMHDLSGIWGFNKSLSDDPEPWYKLQGMPWIFQKLLPRATVTNRITQTTDESGFTRIQTYSKMSGGFEFNPEPYILDGLEHATPGGIQRVRAEWVDFRRPKPTNVRGEPIDSYLTQGWPEDSNATTWDHVYVHTKNDNGGWIVEDVWGFSLIDGKRYFVTRSLMRKGEYCMRMALVREWKGPLPQP